MEVDKSMLESLTEEERRLVEQAGSPKDLVELAQKSGVTLTDEQLDAIAGGRDWTRLPNTQCPNCGGYITVQYPETSTYYCRECYYEWTTLAKRTE